MRDPLEGLPASARERLRKRRQPHWTRPMLATLSDDRFSDPDWLYERKLDGVRCLAFKRGGSVRLMSRNKKQMNETWPEIVDALKAQSASFVVDGEIVAFSGGRTSFSRLQQRIGLTDPDEARSTGIAVYLYLFDLLHVAGCDVTALALRDRKKVLHEALEWRDPLRFTPHRNEQGERWLEQACRKGWEGLIAKRAEAPYRHSRSRDWLKFKCSRRQEFVVVGYTDPQHSRVGFGALLIGYYEDDDLRYAGKVGTGFDDETLQRMEQRMSRIERESCPLSTEPPRVRNAHWIRPELVAEVGFTEWTSAGRLRHPRFLGLRTDKRPKQVVREWPR
jgi:DNA ligase D-like protein (predicted ligase)